MLWCGPLALDDFAAGRGSRVEALLLEAQVPERHRDGVEGPPGPSDADLRGATADVDAHHFGVEDRETLKEEGGGGGGGGGGGNAKAQSIRSAA